MRSRTRLIATIAASITAASLAQGCEGDHLGDDFLPDTADVPRDGDAADAVDSPDRPDDAAPDDSRPDDGSADDGAPDDAAPDDAAPDDAAPDDAAPDDTPDVPAGACDLWRAEYPERAAWVWRAGAGPCDPGEINPDAIGDAVRRVNLYRALVGLPGIVNSPEFSRKAQLCAVMESAMGYLDHTPEPTVPCYTADAYEASSSSNLAWGPASPAGAIDLFIDDSGVDSLGHRRWNLHPPYRQGGFGHANGFQCQWVFGWGVDPGEDFVGYPPPGEFPLQALHGAWSLGADDVSFASATVEVTREPAGTPMTVTGTWVPTAGYGQNTIAWYVSGTVGSGSYRIRITGGSRDFDFTTDLVDCD